MPNASRYHASIRNRVAGRRPNPHWEGNPMPASVSAVDPRISERLAQQLLGRPYHVPDPERTATPYAKGQKPVGQHTGHPPDRPSSVNLGSAKQRKKTKRARNRRLPSTVDRLISRIDAVVDRLDRILTGQQHAGTTEISVAISPNRPTTPTSPPPRDPKPETPDGAPRRSGGPTSPSRDIPRTKHGCVLWQNMRTGEVTELAAGTPPSGHGTWIVLAYDWTPASTGIPNGFYDDVRTGNRKYYYDGVCVEWMHRQCRKMWLPMPWFEKWGTYPDEPRDEILTATKLDGLSERVIAKSVADIISKTPEPERHGFFDNQRAGRRESWVKGEKLQQCPASWCDGSMPGGWSHPWGHYPDYEHEAAPAPAPEKQDGPRPAIKDASGELVVPVPRYPNGIIDNQNTDLREFWQDGFLLSSTKRSKLPEHDMRLPVAGPILSFKWGHYPDMTRTA